MRLVDRNERWDAELGLEPLSSEFTPSWLAMTLQNRRMPVKVLLLDQKTIAGIGNIYACEALWWAKVRPTHLARSLTRAQGERLHTAIRDVLYRAIDLRGSSIDDYVDSEGAPGEFQRELAVYGREGEPCRTCERPIVRTVLGQRGTWWCKHCQK
jgi:formamidopyrimidine-DNA glycosylase